MKGISIIEKKNYGQNPGLSLLLSQTFSIDCVFMTDTFTERPTTSLSV